MFGILGKTGQKKRPCRYTLLSQQTRTHYFNIIPHLEKKCKGKDRIYYVFFVIFICLFFRKTLFL